MRSYQIQDTLGFMKKLLMDNAFDTFLLSEASITTYATFQIDGTFHPDYLSTAEKEQLTAEKYGFALWRRVRPFFFELTKGKNTPLKFRVVLRLAPHNVEMLIAQSGLDIQADQVGGLFLNIHFDGKALFCVSGVSMKLFTLDKTLEHAWDDMLEKFFRREQIPFLTD
ncbi:MAG: DUF5721 family protein [Lachnospiraceae bacterium]|nr:DUF5721 family protein [Lachnospiraceae bacterium]